jgi:xylulokinase
LTAAQDRRRAIAIVGIDIGTQSLKVSVVAADDFRVLGRAARGYAPDYPRPGWAEQAPRLWERALGPAIGQALIDAEVAPSEVRALGIAGQLDGCLAVDAWERPLGPCLIWMDRRAEAEAGVVEEARLRHLTGVTRDASHMAAKIRWLKHHLDSDEAPARFHQPVSYMVARLTGEAVFDRGLASTTMLYGLEEEDWHPELLSAFEIEPSELPRIAAASERAGGLTTEGAELTGLPKGLPVAVGTGDDFSTPLGAGLIAPGRLACVLGTAEVVGALDSQAKIDAGGLLETHGYAAGGYFLENPGWLSGGGVEWLRDLLQIPDFGAFDGLAAEVSPGAEGVIFLPALSGAMAPRWIANARGCFYGLTPAHGPGHLSRAMLEGCAFAMRDVVERLTELLVPLESILLLGGGARSRLWGQIRADCTGLPVQVPEELDTSPLGAALCAAVAGGLQPDLASCAGLLGGKNETIEPDTAHRAAYDDAYHTYHQLFESLCPLFENNTQEPDDG